MDRIDVVIALSTYIYNNIEKQEKLRKSKIAPSIFNEHDLDISHTFEEICEFIQKIFDKRRLQPESGVVALIYLNRTRHRITSYNWKRLVLVSFILSNKEAEDVYSVWNVRFVGFIPSLPVFEINVLELEFLQHINYRLHIETTEYYHYYHQLQLLIPERLDISKDDMDFIDGSLEDNIEPDEDDIEQRLLEISPILEPKRPIYRDKNNHSPLLYVAKPLKPVLPLDFEKLSCADSFA